jgi:hypothetical protein
MSLARNARNINFENAITFEPLDPMNAFILPENYNKGGKQLYSYNTLQKLYKNKEYLAPVTREALLRRLRHLQSFYPNSPNVNTLRLALGNMQWGGQVYHEKKTKRQLVSPFTRREISLPVWFSEKYNEDAKNEYPNGGKFKLLVKYKKDPHKTTKNIAALYG